MCSVKQDSEKRFECCKKNTKKKQQPFAKYKTVTNHVIPSNSVVETVYE